MQPFVLQNAPVDFQYPKPALSYLVFFCFKNILDYDMIIIVASKASDLFLKP